MQLSAIDWDDVGRHIIGDCDEEMAGGPSRNHSPKSESMFDFPKFDWGNVDIHPDSFSDDSSSVDDSSVDGSSVGSHTPDMPMLSNFSETDDSDVGSLSPFSQPDLDDEISFPEDLRPRMQSRTRKSGSCPAHLLAAQNPFFLPPTKPSKQRAFTTGTAPESLADIPKLENVLPITGPVAAPQSAPSAGSNISVGSVGNVGLNGPVPPLATSPAPAGSCLNGPVPSAAALSVPAPPLRSNGLVASSPSHPAVQQVTRAVYPCTFRGCQIRFRTKVALIRHLHTHKGGVKPHECPYRGCHQRFAEHSTLRRHMRVHTGTRPYRCNFKGCGKTFAELTTVRRHTFTHTGSKPYACPHPGCTHASGRGAGLKKHMVTAHEYPKNHPLVLAATTRKRKEGQAVRFTPHQQQIQARLNEAIKRAREAHPIIYTKVELPTPEFWDEMYCSGTEISSELSRPVPNSSAGGAMVATSHISTSTPYMSSSALAHGGPSTPPPRFSSVGMGGPSTPPPGCPSSPPIWDQRTRYRSVSDGNLTRGRYSSAPGSPTTNPLGGGGAGAVRIRTRASSRSVEEVHPYHRFSSPRSPSPNRSYSPGSPRARVVSAHAMLNGPPRYRSMTVPDIKSSGLVKSEYGKGSPPLAYSPLRWTPQTTRRRSHSAGLQAPHRRMVLKKEPDDVKRIKPSGAPLVVTMEMDIPPTRPRSRAVRKGTAIPPASILRRPEHVRRNSIGTQFQTLSLHGPDSPVLLGGTRRREPLYRRASTSAIKLEDTVKLEDVKFLRPAPRSRGATVSGATSCAKAKALDKGNIANFLRAANPEDGRNIHKPPRPRALNVHGRVLTHVRSQSSTTIGRVTAISACPLTVKLEHDVDLGERGRSRTHSAPVVMATAIEKNPLAPGPVQDVISHNGRLGVHPAPLSQTKSCPRTQCRRSSYGNGNNTKRHPNLHVNVGSNINSTLIKLESPQSLQAVTGSSGRPGLVTGSSGSGGGALPADRTNRVCHSVPITHFIG